MFNVMFAFIHKIFGKFRGAFIGKYFKWNSSFQQPLHMYLLLYQSSGIYRKCVK